MNLISVLLSALIVNRNICMHTMFQDFSFYFLTMYVVLVAVFVEFIKAVVFQTKAILELYSQCVFMLFASLFK